MSVVNFLSSVKTHTYTHTPLYKWVLLGGEKKEIAEKLLSFLFVLAQTTHTGW